MTYAGPLRDEPLAIELHNTLYAAGGEVVDGLAGRASAAAWLEALSARLPDGGRPPSPRPEELVALRDAVRAALHAAVDGTAHDAASLEAINRASARAPTSPRADWRNGADPVARPTITPRAAPTSSSPRSRRTRSS